MITALELENFKGIAARQRIEFAPLTLLFGANSAGKSTILQALLYLHELIERGTADVDRTELGGHVLELGGFARFVHRHETNRSIVLRVEFTTPGSLERFGRDLSDFPFPDLEDDIESAWLELTIRYSTTANFRGPLVERAFIGLVNEPLVWLETGASLREGEPLNVRVNLRHPSLGDRAADIAPAWGLAAIPDVTLRPDRAASAENKNSPPGLDEWHGWSDGRPCPWFAVSRSRLSALPPANEPLRVIAFGDDNPEKAAAALQVRTFLEMVVPGTTAQLLASLRDALYIGPLRTIPPRGFLYERAGRIASWGDGLAAWDLLLADRLDLVERTNGWLKRLGADCQVVVQQLFERVAEAEAISEDHVDTTVRRLLLDTGAGSLVLPSEVGAGVSQIIPVIVAALTSQAAFSLIEQPEIHVHPAVQVGLGDLFIDTVTRDGGRRTLLVETHSEHLILRLLRRIRETTEHELSAGAPAFSADKLSVLYVERLPEGVLIQRLHVDPAGEFQDRWPKGFFAERAGELF